ncbi:unnamed protein product [Penicillium glandicola]
MLPSTDDITKFIAIAPEANEGTALRFLEGAENIDDAISRYYDEIQNGPTAPTLPNPANTTMDAENLPPPYARSAIRGLEHHYTNTFIEASDVRSKDEQDIKAALHDVQQACRIFNSDIEPVHASEFLNCNCDVHRYKDRKAARLPVQEMWSKAVMYPGESAYHDINTSSHAIKNPYSRVPSPFPVTTPGALTARNPTPSGYNHCLQKTIQLNETLNTAAQAAINAKEPTSTIWDNADPEASGPNEADTIASSNIQRPAAHGLTHKNNPSTPLAEGSKPSAFGSLKRMLSKKTSEGKAEKAVTDTKGLRMAILEEEKGRWPDQEWRQLVAAYQEAVGINQKVADLRARYPIQYLHLLQAGYFEPIPVAWAKSASNPLKLTIDAVGGWRGVTPGWRGYKDLAEERLYWVMNNKEGVRNKTKPDVISAMSMARSRMESAVEIPTEYFSRDDICNVHSETYSQQVMSPFRPSGEPAVPLDETMILLEVSESINSVPLRPNYKEHLITGYSRYIAKAIIRRFSQAMINHDHNTRGYQLVTFADQARYIGLINQNFEQIWSNVRFGGKARLMLGWQRAKEMHFQKHSGTAIYHPMYGWKAGPETPTLRLLIVVDGEVTDMNEFLLDLLGLSWVYVTIFLMGADRCPDHHRLANELQRISNTNPHISFLDAQGNIPERFVTHELLKRHLRYNVSFSDFEMLEQATVDLPLYTA